MSRRTAMAISVLGLSAAMLATAGAASAGTPATSGPAFANGFSPGGTMLRAGGIHARGRRVTAYSTNWSGYAVAGGAGSFRSASASWTQPAVACGSRSQQYSSFWVGLDGYSSQTVEQIGTDSDCSGPTPQYYGWYEMYPAYPVYFLNTVRPGDRMSASVTFSGVSAYTLVLRDATRGWTRTVVVSRRGLARSSAEVITEAPSSFSGVLPLANFGTVSYSTSAANGTSLNTLSPVRIVMVNNGGQPKDTTSPISSRGAFSNTWLRSS